MTDSNRSKSPQLFSDFPTPSYDEWFEAAVASLKGDSFAKLLTTPLYEGLVLQPIYRREDTEDMAHQHTLPGAYPFVRGTTAAGYIKQPWQIAQALIEGTPQAFNTALLDDLKRGLTTINLRLDPIARRGLDPDDPAAGDAGRGGISIASCVDFAQALKGVLLEEVPLLIQTGASSLGILGLLLAARPDMDTQALHGAITADPLGELALRGEISPDIDVSYDHLAAATSWAHKYAPRLKTVGINTAVYHNGGANAVQELACMLATGVAYLRAMIERGLPANVAGSRVQVTIAVGASFFLEIAKLRAARMAWAQMMRAFGGDDQSQKIALHVESGTYNKTVYDPHVNMLRTAVEGFAAAVGGTDSLELTPFDAVVRSPDAFSRRVARNQQLILQHEANLPRTIDPAGGSWYVETLTDWLAHESWIQFQRIERAGGMLRALQEGIPQAAVAGVAAHRARNLARRKDILVGTNMYPNMGEERLTNTTDYDSIQAERIHQTQAHKSTKRDLSVLENLGTAHGTDLVMQVAKAAAAGATLGEITAALAVSQTSGITPISQERGAVMYEALRQKANAYAHEHGHPPRIFLANMGPLRQHKARTDFTLGFFEVGGFEMINPPGFETSQQAASAAINSSAPVVVICSTDATYPELVPPLVQAIKSHDPDITVILAGYPEDQIEIYRAAGIDEFIHLRANCYEINMWLQEQVELE